MARPAAELVAAHPAGNATAYGAQHAALTRRTVVLVLVLLAITRLPLRRVLLLLLSPGVVGSCLSLAIRRGIPLRVAGTAVVAVLSHSGWRWAAVVVQCEGGLNVKADDLVQLDAQDTIRCLYRCRAACDGIQGGALLLCS